MLQRGGKRKETAAAGRKRPYGTVKFSDNLRKASYNIIGCFLCIYVFIIELNNVSKLEEKTWQVF